MNGLPVFADTGGGAFVADLPTIVWKPLVTLFANTGRNELAIAGALNP